MNLKDIFVRSVQKLTNAGTETPELDARILITSVLKVDQTFLLSHPEFKPGESQKRKILDLVNKRSKSVPIAYLIGHKEFFGYDFLVDRRVLIPRPESEFLVEKALERISNLEARILNDEAKIPNTQFKILDLGTGSGCIIISLIKPLPISYPLLHTFYATDISKPALTVAKKNANFYGLTKKIKFFHSNLFSNPRLPKKLDLIIANLPYVPKTRNKNNGLRTKDIDFEPQDAIFADDNGSEVIKNFLIQVKDRINKNGLILIELDPRNAIEIKEAAENHFPSAQIELKKDLANFDRYLILTC